MDFEHIDLSLLKNLTSENAGKMALYIDMFLELSEPALASMKSSAEQADWDSLRSTAHGLKPQIGYMGIEKLKEVVLKIETYAKEQSHLDQIPSLLSAYENTYLLACKELKDARQQLQVA